MSGSLLGKVRIRSAYYWSYICILVVILSILSVQSQTEGAESASEDGVELSAPIQEFLQDIDDEFQVEQERLGSKFSLNKDNSSMNSSRLLHQRHFIDIVDEKSKESTVRLLDYFRRKNGDGECNPETNIYPCGALDFLGCTGNKKFYAESVIRLNWFEAWEFCRNNDMHLASIESTYEQVFLELFLPKPESGSREGYWLSGTDLGREGLFYWMSNGKSFTYTNWRASEPNNLRKREHCVQMSSNLRSSTESLKWNDLTCNSVGYVICQEPYSRKNEPAAAFDFVQERDNSHKPNVNLNSVYSSVEASRKPLSIGNSNNIHADDDGDGEVGTAAGQDEGVKQDQFLQARPPILSILVDGKH